VTLVVNYQIMASVFREVMLNVLLDGSAVMVYFITLRPSVSGDSRGD
jgi:hypothetical protein